MERIRRELMTKGVDRNTIEDAIAQMEELPDEEQVAMEQAMLMLDGIDTAGMDYQEREKIKARIARRLAGRGFRTDTIYRVARKAMDRAAGEPDLTNEED